MFVKIKLLLIKINKSTVIFKTITVHKETIFVANGTFINILNQVWKQIFVGVKLEQKQNLQIYIGEGKLIFCLGKIYTVYINIINECPYFCFV